MKRLLLGALLLFLAAPAYAGGNYIFHKSFVVEPEYVEIEEPSAADEMTYISTDGEKLDMEENPPATPTDGEDPSAIPTDSGEEETNPPVDDYPSIDSEDQTITLDDEAQADQPEDENPSQADRLDDVADAVDGCRRSS